MKDHVKFKILTACLLAALCVSFAGCGKSPSAAGGEKKAAVSEAEEKEKSAGAADTGKSTDAADAKQSAEATDTKNSSGAADTEKPSIVVSENKPGEYEQIDQDTAHEMMKLEDVIILDVRTPSEYAGRHIKGAVNIPNEEIQDTPPELLPDRNQLILVYCRSGSRSKTASQKLADMGYTKVKEFGGINNWKYEVEE